MGIHYYCVCHTCCQCVSLGRKIHRFDPRVGSLDDDEIRLLTRALAGEADAEQGEEVRHGELGFELAKLAAFAFVHGHHPLEIVTDSDDGVLLRFVEVMDSQWNDPLAHRREGARWPVPPFGIRTSDKCAAELALDDIATFCGCSEWEYPGQVVRDVKQTFAKAVSDVVDLCNPCQSCGADPRVSPTSGEELPIIAGALDAQADAERRAMRAEQAVDDAEKQASLATAAMEDVARRYIISLVACAVLLVTAVVLALVKVGAT